MCWTAIRRLLRPPPQSGNPHVLLDWPHALHILGHIYNNQL